MKMIDTFAKNIDMQDIGLFWQLTIKTINDLKVVGNENLTLEMFVTQLVHLKNIEKNNQPIDKRLTNIDNQESLNDSKIIEKTSESKIPNGVKNQLKNTNQIKTNPAEHSEKQNYKPKIEIKTFQDLIDRANKEKEIELRYDLERNVKIVKFGKGKLDISFNDKLNKNFIKSLTEKLFTWTGERWIISLSKNMEAKSVFEKNEENKNKKIDNYKSTNIAREIEANFSDAKLIDLEEKK